MTGKVKPMAESASVPRKLINQVSTRLKVNSISIPTIIGRVMRIKDSRIEPSTRLCGLADFAAMNAFTFPAAKDRDEVIT